MELERQQTSPQRGGSFPTRVVVGALAIFGVVTLLQWVVGALLGIVKLVLVVAVVVAVAIWVVGAKGSR